MGLGGATVAAAEIELLSAVIVIKCQHMNLHPATSFIPEPQALIGTWRRFGPFGPAYEVMGVGKEESSGDRWMQIRVLESGEVVDYRFGNILDDPKER